MAAPKTPTIEELQAENERLRKELDAKSAASAVKDVQEEISEVAGETNDAALDQVYRIVQAVNAATAELLRSGTDILVKFNEDITAHGKTSQDDLAKTLGALPPDLYKGYLRAIRRAVEVPGRMAETFAATHRNAD